MHRPPARLAALVLIALVAACAPRQPIPLTPPAETATAPVVRRPAEPAPAPTPTPAVPATPAAPVAPAAPASALTGIVVPPDVIYVCVSGQGGQRTQTVIEFQPKVLALCRRHPEMGPCQYERNLCRASGGRVFAANGQEITMATEAEYDRKVMRVRFRSN